MSQFTWNELNEDEQETAKRILSQISAAFQGFAVPKHVQEQIGIAPTYPEIAEIRSVLGTVGWENVNRPQVMNAINQGVAVVNLCESLVFSYFVPLFMSLALCEAFLGNQDETFVTSLVRRVVGSGSSRSLDWSIYSDKQKDVIKDFLYFTSAVFCEVDLKDVIPGSSQSS